MNSWKIFSAILGGFFLLVFLIYWPAATSEEKLEKEPNDWFYTQRAFPQGQINHAFYLEGMEQAKRLKAESASRENASWTLAGPTNVGGRISDLAVTPGSMDTIYAGAASGGIFRSVDGGNDWQPIFDEALSLSIGDIAIAPSNSKIIYVGTGEVNAGGGSQTYDGAGIYRSSDGGDSWEQRGLIDSRYISRIAVHPSNPDHIYAGVMGKLFAENSERGIYRSYDGGNAWEQVFFLSDSTGCIDLLIHPENPDTLYAAMWERIRMPHRRSYGGVTSGLYRSYDGGDSWEELTNGVPNNAADVGRIGIAISSSQPNILYTIYADVPGYFDGVYKSIDNGDSWTRTNDNALSSLYSSFGWWFGNIRVDPQDPDIVYALGLDIYKTTNGGNSWAYRSGGIHVDQHALYIDPQNSDNIVAGNDGGIYISTNGGASYQKSANLPITQFYTTETDFQYPERLYGGTQDNGTIRTLSGSLDDWNRILGGDGFYVIVDPTNNAFVYAESQRGVLRRSTNGGASFISATAGLFGRSNWSAPLTMDPGNPEVLYFGQDRVFKSTNRGAFWNAISPDLSNGPSSGNLTFGTVTTIDVAATDSSVIYAGTDDGNLWVTTDGGNAWQQISGELPQRWVTRVTVDPQDAATAYVTFSGYRWDEYLPHVFRTTNYGTSWRDISANLPEIPLNDIIADPDRVNLLYVASDAGVFYSDNLGGSWQALGNNFPNVPVTDLVLHTPSRTLTAATFGRSMWQFDLSQLTAIDDRPAENIPGDITLAQNYPNPFNGETHIDFQLKKAGMVNLTIYDIRGKKILTLAQRIFSNGHHSVRWDGRDGNGSPVASGNYIYRLKYDNHLLSRRMILVQ